MSDGQQQRLCIARALTLEPEILLPDASAGAVIEELMFSLKDRCTLLMVSHYLDQVKRVADTALELSDGNLLKYPNN